GVTERCAGDVTGRGAVDEDWLGAHHHRLAVVDGQADKAPLDGSLRDAGERIVPDVPGLLRAHGEADACLEGVVLGGHVGTPRAVALLDRQAVEGRPARGDDAVALTFCPQRVPQPQTVFGGCVQL